MPDGANIDINFKDGTNVLPFWRKMVAHLATKVNFVGFRFLWTLDMEGFPWLARIFICQTAQWILPVYVMG